MENVYSLLGSGRGSSSSWYDREATRKRNQRIDRMLDYFEQHLLSGKSSAWPFTVDIQFEKDLEKKIETEIARAIERAFR